MNDMSTTLECYVCASCQHTTSTPGILYPAIYDDIIVRLHGEPMLLCAKAYNEWLNDIEPSEPHETHPYALSDDNICLKNDKK